MVKPWETDLSVYADEATLLEGLRRRDREACTCLLKRFAPRLYRLALQLMSDPDEAEDVLQEGVHPGLRPHRRLRGAQRSGHLAAPDCPQRGAWAVCAASRSPPHH